MAMRHNHSRRAPALAFLIAMLFCTTGAAHCSTYYFLDLSCDLFPFLPIWSALLAIWPVMLIIGRRGRSSIIKSSLVIAVMIAVVIILPQAFQISALLFFLLALYFLVDYIVLWKRRNDEKSRLLFRMESALLAAALFSALIITLICHIPAVLVYRLGSSHSFLVEEWILKGGKGFDEPLRRALINRGTADRLKVLNLMMGRNDEISSRVLEKILESPDEDIELKAEIIRYLGRKESAEALPALVTMLAESESSGLSLPEKTMALKECLYDAVSAINLKRAITLINENSSLSAELKALVLLKLVPASYSRERYGDMLASMPPEALISILSRSDPSSNVLRGDVLARIRVRGGSEPMVKAIVDIQKKDDMANIPLLIALLKSDDSTVRSTANWALINLTGKNFNYDAEGSKKERDRAAGQWESWCHGVRR